MKLYHDFASFLHYRGVLNPHGSDETLIGVPNPPKITRVLNPHGSDETLERIFKQA